MKLAGHTDEVQTVTFSPRGQFVASGSFDKTLRFWDIGNGQETYQFPTAQAITALDWHPRGDRLIAGDASGRVLVLELKRFEPDRPAV
jgi:WD40 repeat protein